MTDDDTETDDSDDDSDLELDDADWGWLEDSIPGLGSRIPPVVLPKGLPEPNHVLDVAGSFVMKEKVITSYLEGLTPAGIVCRIVDEGMKCNDYNVNNLSFVLHNSEILAEVLNRQKAANSSFGQGIIFVLERGLATEDPLFAALPQTQYGAMILLPKGGAIYEDHHVSPGSYSFKHPDQVEFMKRRYDCLDAKGKRVT